jgi:hypothetical protein
MKWKYAVKNIPVSDAKGLEDELKAAGSEGWELAAYIERPQTTGSIGPAAHLFIFKRASE